MAKPIHVAIVDHPRKGRCYFWGLTFARAKTDAEAFIERETLDEPWPSNMPQPYLVNMLEEVVPRCNAGLVKLMQRYTQGTNW